MGNDRRTCVRLGETIACKVPWLGWKVTQPGNLADFERLMDLLMEVEAFGAPLAKTAQEYGAVVYEE